MGRQGNRRDSPHPPRYLHHSLCPEGCHSRPHSSPRCLPRGCRCPEVCCACRLCRCWTRCCHRPCLCCWCSRLCCCPCCLCWCFLGPCCSMVNSKDEKPKIVNEAVLDVQRDCQICSTTTTCSLFLFRRLNFHSLLGLATRIPQTMIPGETHHQSVYL